MLVLVGARLLEFLFGVVDEPGMALMPLLSQHEGSPLLPFLFPFLSRHTSTFLNLDVAKRQDDHDSELSRWISRAKQKEIH